MSHPHGAVRCVQPVRVSGETVAKSCKEKRVAPDFNRNYLGIAGQTSKLKAISIGDIKFFEMYIKWLFSSYLCCLLTTLRPVKRLSTWDLNEKAMEVRKIFPPFRQQKELPTRVWVIIPLQCFFKKMVGS